MVDKFKSFAVGRTSPGVVHAALTPDDDTDINPRPRALYIAVAGDVELIDENGVAITYPSVPVGPFPFSPVRLGEATAATVIGWA